MRDEATIRLAAMGEGPISVRDVRFIISLLDAARADSKRYRWRPISEANEDHGPIVLMDINDPGHLRMSHVCNCDWDEESKGMTHFSQILPLNYEDAERLRDEYDAARGAK